MTRRLTLRARLALLTAAAVALAVAACATAGWALTRNQLYSEVDRRLGDMSKMVPAPSQQDAGPLGRQGRYFERAVSDALLVCHSTAYTVDDQNFRGPIGPDSITQLTNAAGRPCTLPNSGFLEVGDADVQVARGERAAVIHNGTGTTSSGRKIDVRVLTHPYTTPDGQRLAVSVALPLDEVEGPLGNLALLLVAVSALGVLVSAGAGLMIARAGLRPVDELTGVVEHIARTEDLDTRIPEEGTDEIARLSRSFNSMTSALAASRDHQQQLIADAGHELRTPLTSLRTNIDLLLRSESTGRALPAGTRHNLMVSVKAQMLELTSLVGDLLELARPTEAEPVRATVSLHDVVARAVERARLRGPSLTVRADTEPWYVLGDPGSLERAVVNLLDNAVKFSPPGGTIGVQLKAGELTVRDHGPGIPPQDLPHVFERFWRSPSARSLPGSGLGLSIVARVVEEGGGRVALEPAAGGGTLARIRLPGASYPGD